MKLWTPTQTAFALHILVEAPAALFFFFRPSQTLQSPQPHAHAVIRQYALLLMSTNIIAAAAFLRESEEITKTIAGALALYHVGPIFRAFSRSMRKTSGTKMGSPWGHAVFHTLCLTLMLNVYLGMVSW